MGILGLRGVADILKVLLDALNILNQHLVVIGRLVRSEIDGVVQVNALLSHLVNLAQLFLKLAEVDAVCLAAGLHSVGSLALGGASAMGLLHL